MTETALTDAAVDEEIGQDWQAILERHSEEPAPAEPAPAEPAEPTEPAAPTEPAEPAPAQQARDKSGKFKAAPQRYKPEKQGAKPAAAKPAAPAAAPVEPQPGAAPAPGAPAAEPQARDITKAPPTWRPLARAAWAQLPEAVRAEIHRREQDFLNGHRQVLPDAQFGATMAKALEPYRMLIESEGGNPETATVDLFKTAAILRTGSVDQKYQTAANILNRFGLDPRLLVPRQFMTPQGQVIPPAPAPQQQLRDPRVDALIAAQQTQEQQRLAQETRDTEATVGRWMNELDKQGQPLRPYVNDVLDEMTDIVRSLRARDSSLSYTAALDAAYERAIWAHPEIRVLLQQQQQTATDARRRADNQQRTVEARRAASVNVRPRASIPAPARPGTMEETIAEEAHRLGLA